MLVVPQVLGIGLKAIEGCDANDIPCLHAVVILRGDELMPPARLSHRATGEPPCLRWTNLVRVVAQAVADIPCPRSPIAEGEGHTLIGLSGRDPHRRFDGALANAD